jgi:hypothetical protein
MPVIEAQRASILVPHDHLHISQMRASPRGRFTQIAARVLTETLTAATPVTGPEGNSRICPIGGIMPVIKDYSPFGLGIMPDHASDRAAARLDPGASRSQAYQTRCGQPPGKRRCIKYGLVARALDHNQGGQLRGASLITAPTRRSGR